LTRLLIWDKIRHIGKHVIYLRRFLQHIIWFAKNGEKPRIVPLLKISLKKIGELNKKQEMTFRKINIQYINCSKWQWIPRHNANGYV